MESQDWDSKILTSARLIAKEKKKDTVYIHNVIQNEDQEMRYWTDNTLHARAGGMTKCHPLW